MDDAWEAILNDRLEGREQTTMEEAGEKLGIKSDRLDKSIQTRIGMVLATIGFRRKKIQENGKRGYRYERRIVPPDSAF